MENNVIYCGDCLEVMEKIKDNTIDLIYLDPPFFSRKEYENFWIKDKVTKFKFSDKDWEKFRSKIKPNILKQYEDIEKRWKGGHKGIYVYIAYMRERLEQCWRVLKPTGSIYLHCDWHAGHYLKQVMDEVFGYDRFVNEIVWKRTHHPKGSQFKDKKYGTYTDSILFYTKSEDYTFELERVRPQLSEEELKKKYPRVDEKGRYLMYPIVRSASKGERPNLVYEYKGYTPVKWGWVVKKEKLIAIDKRGDLGWTSRKTPFRKYRLEEDRGTPIGNLWDDIHRVGGDENLGYPTQKPVALLERIITVSSNEGDVVLDPFCGCGTTLSAAQRLNREFIGIDISRGACDVMRKRLGKKGIRVIGGESEKELAKTEPHEFARIMIVEKLGGTVNRRKTGDMGIDGWVDFMKRPVQVKRWKHKVQRQEVDKFAHAIQREKKKKGMIIAFDFSRDCWNEVERIKREDKIDIQLKTVREIMGLDYYGANSI